MIKYVRLRWTGHVTRRVESRGSFNILTRNPTVKKHLGRRRHRWEENIKMNEIYITTRKRVDSVQDRDYWTALLIARSNLRVP